MCTFPSCGLIPNIDRKPVNSVAIVSGSSGGSGRRTPLGLPVVPEV
jgi:hypothetical protein